MPVDFTAGPPQGDPTPTESAPFAPIPTWERNNKRRGKGGERRSFFSQEPAKTAVIGAAAGATTGAMADETPLSGTPTYADRRSITARRGGSAAPIAIVAGLLILAGVAAAGWYATQPHDQGMAEMTPGGAPSAAPAETSSAPTTGPALAQNTAAPAPTAKAAAAARPHATMPAARRQAPASARSRSVEDEGVNASATVPTPAPRAAPVTPPPSAAAPAPAPTPVPATPAPPAAAPVNPANPPPTETTSPTPPPDQPPPQ
jgi:Meckel syndrome type 1 protein